MDVKHFFSGLEKVEALMQALETDDQKPIKDGVIDANSYLNSKYKILWLLKEAYDNDDNGRYGWSLSELLGGDDVYTRFLKTTRSKTTWYPIIYISYSILNGFPPYDDLAFIDDDPDTMTSILKNIAIVNINKLAGNSTSNNTSLKRVLLSNEKLLKMQIDILNPDIIIGGNTLDFYYNLLDLGHCNYIYFNHIKAERKYYVSKDQLYIDAFHPARRNIPKYRCVNEGYIDDIINVCRTVLNN